MRKLYKIIFTITLSFFTVTAAINAQKDTTEFKVGKKELIIVDKKTQQENAIYNLEKGKESFEKEIKNIEDDISKDKRLIKISKSDLQIIGDSINLLENNNKEQNQEQIKYLKQKYFAVQYNIKLLEKDIDLNRKKEQAFNDGIADINNGIEDIKKGIENTDKDLNIDKDKITGKKLRIENRNHSSFNSHWAGFQFGLLNFLNEKRNLSTADELSFMVVIPEKTMSYGLNIFEYDVSLNKKHRLGLATGAGLEWNSLALKQNVNLYEDENGIICAEYVDKDVINYTKNKLNAVYITVPLIIEIQIPVKHRKFFLYSGITGGIRAWSKQKQKYTVNGQTYKNKKTDDFRLSSFRYGATAGIGYGDIGLYINYSLVPLFKIGAGPEMYPISVGIKIADF